MKKEDRDTLILISEDRLKELLDNQVDAIAEVMGEVENRLSYRIYNGVKSELRRQLRNGGYNGPEYVNKKRLMQTEPDFNRLRNC